MPRRLLPALLSLLTVPVLLVSAPAPAHAASYSAPLTTAINDLVAGTENRTGYSRDLFRHWVDADGDGCHARNEVLIAESETTVSVGSSCTLSGGRWYSYYDGASWTNPADVDIDHMVALAEAWDSGASAWSSSERQSFANDLGDYRTLVGVTDDVNQAKGDQDPATWLPTYQRCRYIAEWVAVKHRWGLRVDTAERSALRNVASGCTNVTITVTKAR